MMRSSEKMLIRGLGFRNCTGQMCAGSRALRSAEPNAERRKYLRRVLGRYIRRNHGGRYLCCEDSARAAHDSPPDQDGGG